MIYEPYVVPKKLFTFRKKNSRNIDWQLGISFNKFGGIDLRLVIPEADAYITVKEHHEYVDFENNVIWLPSVWFHTFKNKDLFRGCVYEEISNTINNNRFHEYKIHASGLLAHEILKARRFRFGQVKEDAQKDIDNLKDLLEICDTRMKELDEKIEATK